MTTLKNFSGDIVAGLVVLISLLLLLNPFDILMLSMGAMLVLSCFVIAVLTFAAFIWRERAADEREVVLVGNSGRIAYLVGAGILSVGIIMQTLAHVLDIWLVYALGAMVLSKIAASIYYQIYS